MKNEANYVAIYNMVSGNGVNSMLIDESGKNNHVTASGLAA